MPVVENLTVMIVAYNEEERIEQVIRSVSDWADEIILIDKSSTDQTASIARSASNNVRVVVEKYTDRGADDFSSYTPSATNDWIFLVVASEAVEAGLPNLISKYFVEHGPNMHDVVMIPRRYIAFGAHLDYSPWSIVYFPFMFNRKRALITNKLHEHFNVTEESRRFFLSSQDNCRVTHTTHTSALSYMNSMIGYFKEEVRLVNPEDIDAKYLETLYAQFKTYEARVRKSSDLSATMHYAAWSIYWHGVILFACEKKLLSVNIDSSHLPTNQLPDFSSNIFGTPRTLNNFRGFHNTPLNFIRNLLRPIYRKHILPSNSIRKIFQIRK